MITILTSLENTHIYSLKRSEQISQQRTYSKNTKMFLRLILVSSVTFVAYAIYKFITNSARYFEDKNVKYKGVSFTLSNLYSMFTGKFKGFGQIEALYNAYPNEP